MPRKTKKQIAEDRARFNEKYPHLAKQDLSEEEIFTEIAAGTCTLEQFGWWVNAQKYNASRAAVEGPRHGW